jgi:hypothetical protein
MVIKQPNCNIVTIIARQTDLERSRDYVNVFNIALFGTPTITRMIDAYKTINEVRCRYPGAKIEMAGWSAGGIIPQIFWNQVNEGFAYNPGTYYGNMLDKNMYPNYRVERNGMDLVSMWGVRGSAERNFGGNQFAGSHDLDQIQ